VHPNPFYITAPNTIFSILPPNHGNKYTQLKITPILSLSSLFVSPKSNANVTIKGSCNMQRFFIFVAPFTIFLHFDVVSLFLLTQIHHKSKMQQLLLSSFVFFLMSHLHKTTYFHQVQ
jgi:hypothetical protein